MRLDQALVARGLAPSRARAREFIREAAVTVDGRAVTKASSPVTEDAVIAVAAEAHDYVSRAALKLEAALETFGVDPLDLVCLDLGSSTGGFTEVLLRRGARRVFAVDVGTDQLHPRLRDEPRVVSLEQTHARDLCPDLIPQPLDLVVCDVSFISILKALPPALALARDGAMLVTLVKPQFELGPEAIGKNGRVLTPQDEQRRYIDTRIVPEIEGWGLRIHAICQSPIKGGEGTTEYLLHAQKTAAAEGPQAGAGANTDD